MSGGVVVLSVAVVGEAAGGVAPWAAVGDLRNGLRCGSTAIAEAATKN